jgi:hypothetical protein
MIPTAKAPLLEGRRGLMWPAILSFRIAQKDVGDMKS